MIDMIRRKLIELARSSSTWTYSQLNEQLDLKLDFRTKYDRELVSEWLEAISTHESKNGRPLLSALIIAKGQDKAQADSFFKLCEKLYSIPWRELKAENSYELERIKECYSFWQNPDNYSSHKDDY